MFKTNILQKKSINEICRPIAKEIYKADSELKKMIGSLELDWNKDQLDKITKNPGKRVRQAIFLLPVKAILTQTADVNDQVLKLAALSEIVFDATKLHEEISDRKRGRRSLSNPLAILTGDILLTSVFLSIAEVLPLEHVKELVMQVEKACLAQVSKELAAIDIPVTKEEYLKQSEEKAKVFMGTLLKFAVHLTQADEQALRTFEHCALKLGTAYEIMEDCKDGKTKDLNFDAIAEIELIVKDIKQTLLSIEESACKNSLVSLTDYLMNFAGKNMKQ